MGSDFQSGMAKLQPTNIDDLKRSANQILSQPFSSIGRYVVNVGHSHSCAQVNQRMDFVHKGDMKNSTEILTDSSIIGSRLSADVTGDKVIFGASKCHCPNKDYSINAKLTVPVNIGDINSHLNQKELSDMIHKTMEQSSLFSSARTTLIGGSLTADMGKDKAIGLKFSGVTGLTSDCGAYSVQVGVASDQSLTQPRISSALTTINDDKTYSLIAEAKLESARAISDYELVFSAMKNGATSGTSGFAFKMKRNLKTPSNDIAEFGVQQILSTNSTLNFKMDTAKTLNIGLTNNVDKQTKITASLCCPLDMNLGNNIERCRIGASVNLSV